MSDQTMTIGHRAGDSIEMDKDGKVLKVNGVEVADAETPDSSTRGQAAGGRGDAEKEQKDESPETPAPRKGRKGKHEEA